MVVAVAVVGVAGLASSVRPPVPPSSTGPASFHRAYDVPWRTVGAEHLTLDAFWPVGATTGRAAMLLIHGGGWEGGDKQELDQEGQLLATLGYAAVSVNYRLAPRFRFPSALEDVRAAVAWLRQPAQVRRYGLDPARVGVLGDSAGGHLAALLATSAPSARPRGDPIRAAVSWSGPMDLEADTGVPFPPLLADAVSAFLGCAPAACPVTAATASPITHVTRDTAPMLLVNSTDELVPLDQAQRTAAALTAAGAAEQLLVVPGQLHATAYATQVWEPTVAFLARFLPPRPRRPGA